MHSKMEAIESRQSL